MQIFEPMNKREQLEGLIYREINGKSGKRKRKKNGILKR